MSNQLVSDNLNSEHGGNTPQRSSCTNTDHPSRKLSKLDELDMQDTAEEVGTSS